MRKTTLCKKTSESPGCSSSLIGQKNFSGQSAAANSNASGTGSVRASAPTSFPGLFSAEERKGGEKP